MPTGGKCGTLIRAERKLTAVLTENGLWKGAAAVDYDALLLLASDLGYGLLESGAEIYRVEESIQRFLLAYGVAEADPFVIPNCIFVSFTTPDGAVKSQVRRITAPHGTDVDQLELYNGLCRSLCAEVPPLPQARERLQAVEKARRSFSLSTVTLSYFLCAAFFSLFFGGSVRDGLCAGACGVVVGLCMAALSWLRTNLFLKTMLSSALSAFTALALTFAGLGEHSDLIIIGAFMALVPGVMFTNSIRDIMAGDMMAGLSKLADSLLTGVSLALGAALALGASQLLFPLPASTAPAPWPYCLPVLFAFLGSGGFFAVYNIHTAAGTLICAFGGALGWLTYLLAAPLLQSDIAQTLAAAIVISAYAEIMARLRKCPVTSYQMLALFPLVPGAGIYYTMEYAVGGDVNAFFSSLLHVLGVAGALAVGVLMVSSAVRMYTTFHHKKEERP